MKKINKIIKEIIKSAVDTYISFECFIIRFVSKLLKYKKQYLAESINDRGSSDEKATRKKLLILRKDVIGDFVLFIPTLKYYREFYKDYEISLVVNTVAKDLSSQLPAVDNIIYYEGKKFRTSFFYRRSFMHSLAKAGFDTVIHAVYSREYIGDRMVRATGAKNTIAFKSDYGDMYTDRQYSKLIETPLNITEPERNMLFVSEVTGIDCKVKFPSLDISLFDDEEYLKIKERFSLTDGDYCVFIAGAGATYRTWQLEKFAEVADYIVEKYKLKVVLSGANSEKDKELSRKIKILCKHKDSIIDATSETKIPGTAHLLKHSKFYFGSETGPLHLAIAISVPALTILGGGHFGRFFPYGNPQLNRYVADENAKCRGDGWRCSENLGPGEIAPCIRDITVEDTLKEIDILIENINKNEKNY